MDPLIDINFMLLTPLHQMRWSRISTQTGLFLGRQPPSAELPAEPLGQTEVLPLS